MLGVIVNVITVMVGSLLGLLFKKGIPERVSKAAMVGLGACSLYIGISGSLCGENVLILIGAVVLGAITGTPLSRVCGSPPVLGEWQGPYIPRQAAAERQFPVR